ncbi:hypothetical protein KJ830_04465 [bacterium]|nr:hypothetical protein [bacterium]MBU4510285.1 hypothetical protein [bacterium]
MFAEELDRELDLITQAKMMKDKLSITMVTTKIRNISIQQTDVAEVIK